MLTLRTLSRVITYHIRQSSQQIHTAPTLLSTKDPSSSSSSSDSSDSDSDSDSKSNEKVQKFKGREDEQTFENLEETSIESNKDAKLNILSESTISNNQSDTNERLNTLLQSLINKTPTSKTANVAIKPKSYRFKKSEEEIKLKEKKLEDKKPFEQKLAEAAKDAAKVISGDQQKNELELLSRLLNIDNTPEKVATNEATKQPAFENLSDLLSTMKIERRQKRRQQFVEFPKQESASAKILSDKYQTQQSRVYSKELKESKGLDIFKFVSQKEKNDSLQLSTWNAMEERELKLSIMKTPRNTFEELIQWTEQGKLWNFPINNEQGLEEEENVHFSEHVFMEHHIKDWCPKKGPIRHFMELVCTGLSMNPYMTVEEKVGHLTWYRSFFEDKQDLLHDLGVLDDKKSGSLPLPDQKQN